MSMGIVGRRSCGDVQPPLETAAEGWKSPTQPPHHNIYGAKEETATRRQKNPRMRLIFRDFLIDSGRFLW